MNAWLAWESGELWHVAGWTMLHFLWLGALAGLVASACRLALRRASANVRYVAALACLAALAALPVGIGAWLVAKPQAMPVTENTAMTTSAPSAPGSAGGSIGAFRGERPASVAPIVARELELIPNTTTYPRPSRGLTDAIAGVTEFLPWIWIIGTPLTFVVLATGVVGAERLRRSSRVIHDGPIAEACARLINSLQIGRRATVAVCERIAAPVLVGIVRPIILLPPAAITGWSPDEIEMVLLHELAHVRRWDNLVNLVQRCIESLLFFHPAVWLVSNWVRREREACCDAFVVGRIGKPQAYAELLVAFAAQMPRSVLFHPAASSAMAAGPLRSRIRRILKLEDDPMLISGKSLGVIIGGLLVAATLFVLNLPQQTTAEEPAQQDAGMIDTETEKRNQIGQIEAMNHLKDLALALHGYHDAKGALPSVASFDANGRPLLSWRVHLLPYLDGTAAEGGNAAALYKEFHIDEPWDSVHNRKLIPRIPAVFRNSNSASSTDSGFTNLLAVVGDDCVFDGSAKGIKFSEVPDGTSNTIMLVEADQAVEWTKPDDLHFNPEIPKAGLGTQRPNRWVAAFADGSVRLIEKDEPDEKVRDMFTCGRKNESIADEQAGAQVRIQFPTLEDQKLADLAYRRLDMEFELLNEKDLARVQALGYEGGLKVTHGRGSGSSGYGQIQWGDILVGLHVWPIRNTQDVIDVLNRDDLGELNPLKFYVVRPTEASMYKKSTEPDEVVTGRITVDVPDRPTSRSSSTAKPRPPVAVDLPPASLPAEPPSPRVVVAAPTPIPLGAAESPPAARSSDPQLDRQLADDPRMTMLNQKLMDLQYELQAQNQARSGDNSQAVEKLESQIADTQQSINKYRQQLELQHLADQPDNAELRYAGKTFDQWRTIWQTELSLERRLEVVKALAAFGASGRGKEAAQAILEVANQLDWTSIDTGTSAGELKQGCIDAFTTGQSTEGYRIPVKDWWPLVVPIYETSPEKSTIVTYLSYQLPAGEKDLIPKLLALSQKGGGTQNLVLNGLRAVDPQLQDDRVVLRLRELLTDPHASPDTLRAAMHSLIYSPTSGAGGGFGGAYGGPTTVLCWVPELQQMLFHPDLEVRQTTRFAITHIQKKDAAPLVEYLIHIIDKQGSDRERSEAIRALAVLGSRAAPAEDKLAAIAHDRNDLARFAAAAALMGLWPETNNWPQNERVKKLLGAAPGETLAWSDLDRKVGTERQEIFGVYQQPPGGGGGGIF